MVQIPEFLRVAAMSLLLAAGASGPVNASGSGTGDSDSAAYEHGKSVMYRQLACESCELGDLPESAEEARQVIERLQAGEIGVGLAARDRRAVIHYLHKRWQL